MKILELEKKIYWEFGNRQLNNRHLLISGNSGMGKTYCIQGLLFELAKQGISTVIFDYTDGFTEQKLDPIFTESLNGKIEEQYVKIDKFPINPFSRHEIQIGSRTMLETDVDIANRLSSVFETVYKFGAQQKSVIYEAIKSGFKEYKDNIETLSQCDKEMTDLMHMIEGSRIGIFFYIRYYWKIRKNRRIRRECKVNLEIIDQIRETLRFNFRGLNMMQESLDNIYYPIYNYRTDWTVDQNRLVDTLTAHCQ